MQTNNEFNYKRMWFDLKESVTRIMIDNANKLLKPFTNYYNTQTVCFSDSYSTDTQSMMLCSNILSLMSMQEVKENKLIANESDKTAEWEDGVCSNCGYNRKQDSPSATPRDYCPSCGCKMIKDDKDV